MSKDPIISSIIVGCRCDVDCLHEDFWISFLEGWRCIFELAIVFLN